MLLFFIGLGVAAWLACGYIAGAMYFAHLQRHWPTLAASDVGRDRCSAWVMCFAGLIALVILTAARDYRHGFVWDWPRAKSGL